MEGLGDGSHLLHAGVREGRAAVIELGVAQLFPAPEDGAEEREGRCSRLADQVDDDPQDNPPHAELGVVEAPAHGDIQLDLAIPVFQQGDGEPDGQLGGLGAIDLLAERKLVDEDVVPCIELALGDRIAQIEGELALGDGVARIGPRVRRCGA